MATTKKKAGKARPASALPTRTGIIRARVEPAIKVRVETILETLGLNPSDAIRLFYTQISLRNGLPFAVEIPNAETIRAIGEVERGEVTRYPDTAAMFKELGI